MDSAGKLMKGWVIAAPAGVADNAGRRDAESPLRGSVRHPSRHHRVDRRLPQGCQGRHTVVLGA
jgi:hypothetical protein